MPTMIEVAASAFKSLSSLLWLLLATVLVVSLPTPSTANPMAVPLSPVQQSSPPPPPESLFATCHFADSSLIVIEEKLNQLFIRLSDGTDHRSSSDEKQKNELSETTEKMVEKEEDDEENSIERLNSTYRSLVNRFAQVPEEESPLPALRRMRRQLWEQFNSPFFFNKKSGHHSDNNGFAFPHDVNPFVLEKEDEEWENEVEGHLAPSSTSTSTTVAPSSTNANDASVQLSPKWHSMIVTCLEHYRILKRIILFERFLRIQQEDQKGQKQQQQQEMKEKLMTKLKKTLELSEVEVVEPQRPVPGWHQKMICSVSRRLQSWSACLKLYGPCLLANKVLIAGAAALIMLIIVLNCFRFSSEELMFYK